MPKHTIIFIHGLWLHSSSWRPWKTFFDDHGYDCFSPGWPGDGISVLESRAKKQEIANRGIKEIADSYATYISTLRHKPILIGHSFGGLMVQLLLCRGLGAAGIAIDPAPIKGAGHLSLKSLWASFPVLGNPFNLRKAISLTPKQFRSAVGNAVPPEESRHIYHTYNVPSPARPMFQVAFASFNSKAENKVDTANSDRGPLLITSGEKDLVVPPVLCRATFNQYKNSTAVTELKSFPNRGHSLVSDRGWKEIAQYSLKWLREKGF